MSSTAQRFARYRPLLDRLTFGVALLGVLDTVHLGIQQARGFDRGCLGFTTSEAVESAFDCAVVTQSGAGELFGLSNAFLGLLFYLAVAALSFAVIYAGGQTLQRLKGARAALVGVGFAYSVYLTVLQFTGLGALCALCLISAAIATLLFGLVAADFFTTPAPSDISASAMPARSPRREGALFAALAAVLLLLTAADFYYFNAVDPPAARAQTPAQAAVGGAAAGGAEGGRDCTFDPAKSAVSNPQRLVNFMDPIKGNRDARVTVVEFFDPNCPACKQFHPVMEYLVENYGDQARFVFKPMPLWDYSVPQIEALYVAQQQGLFSEMLEAQFARLGPEHGGGGLSVAQLQEVAGEIGLDPEALATELEEGTQRARALQNRQLAAEVGVNSTPTVLVNGRFVQNTSRSAECLATFIEEAAGSDGAASSE